MQVMVYYDTVGRVSDCKTMAGHRKCQYIGAKMLMYTIRRKYAYAERHGLKLRRTINSFFDQFDKECALYIVNYQVNGVPGELESAKVPSTAFSKAHGNSRRGNECFIRTKPSVLQSLKKYGKSMAPKQLITAIQNDAGGVYGMSSPSDVIRNRNQVYNNIRSIPGRIKSRNTGKVKLTDYSKVLTMLHDNDFVKDVSFGARNKHGKTNLIDEM